MKNLIKSISYKKLLFLILSLGSLITCSVETVPSSEVNSHVFYRNYGLDYDAQTRELRAKARFTVGGWTGTTLKLVDDASISLNNEPLEEVSLFGTSYSLRKLFFQLKPEYTFTFRNNANAVSKETFAFPASISLVESPKINEALVAHKDMYVSLEGPFLNASETVVCSAHTLEKGQPAQLTPEQQKTLENQDNKTIEAQHYVDGDFNPSDFSCVFLYEKLSQLPLGRFEITAKRTRKQNLNSFDGDLGGSFTASYQSKPMTFTLK